MNQVVTFFLTEVLVIALHDAEEARARKLHELTLHDMTVRVLVFSPEDTVLDHGVRIESHGFECRQRPGAEWCIGIRIRVRRRGPGTRVW